MMRAERSHGTWPPARRGDLPAVIEEAQRLLAPAEAADAGPSLVNTVRTHVRHVYEKLGTHGRAEAVERARALGLLAPSSRRP